MYVQVLSGLFAISSAAFECSSAGTFAEESDCSTYYVCDSDLKLTTKDCPMFTYFNPSHQGCEAGSASACSNNGEDASSTTTPKTSTEPTTTPTTTSTTTPKPTTSHECLYSGQTFPDPTDCHSYYYCDENKFTDHRTCGIFSTGILGIYDDHEQGCIFSLEIFC